MTIGYYFISSTCFFSCNIGEGGICLAEAVHGSAPDIAGKVREKLPFFLLCSSDPLILFQSLLTK